jgi:hypothetical protein
MKITLCGSTRYMEAFQSANERLTLAGHVVYTVAMFSHRRETPPTAWEKTVLDLVHLRKIAESDAIMLIGREAGSQHPYIGESTRRELEWARLLGRSVFIDVEDLVKLTASGWYHRLLFKAYTNHDLGLEA